MDCLGTPRQHSVYQGMGLVFWWGKSPYLDNWLLVLQWRFQFLISIWLLHSGRGVTRFLDKNHSLLETACASYLNCDTIHSFCLAYRIQGNDWSSNMVEGDDTPHQWHRCLSRRYDIQFLRGCLSILTARLLHRWLYIWFLV